MWSCNSSFQQYSGGIQVICYNAKHIFLLNIFVICLLFWLKYNFWSFLCSNNTANHIFRYKKFGDISDNFQFQVNKGKLWFWSWLCKKCNICHWILQQKRNCINKFLFLWIHKRSGEKRKKISVEAKLNDIGIKSEIHTN